MDFRIGGDRAFYDPRHDFVRGPTYTPTQAYFAPINWHQTALHEVSHASGHLSRLNRDLTGSFGSKKYAVEELIAEIASAMTAATLGIGFDPASQDLEEGFAAWIPAAIAQAQKVSDYLVSMID